MNWFPLLVTLNLRLIPAQLSGVLHSVGGLKAKCQRGPHEGAIMGHGHEVNHLGTEIDNISIYTVEVGASAYSPTEDANVRLRANRGECARSCG